MIINYKIKVIPVLVTLVLAFGCKDDNIVNNKTDLDLFTSSVIIDSNHSMTTQNSKISVKIPRTVELHNFNPSLILEPTYKIDDIEYLTGFIMTKLWEIVYIHLLKRIVRYPINYRIL